MCMYGCMHTVLNIHVYRICMCFLVLYSERVEVFESVVFLAFGQKKHLHSYHVNLSDFKCCKYEVNKYFVVFDQSTQYNSGRDRHSV